MGIDSPDATNACIPASHPLIFQALPLPSATRGEPVVLDGDGGRLNDTRALLLYAVGKLLVVRDVLDGSGWVYRGHSSAVTAARFHPAGTFVASGDKRGKLRIWSYDHPQHLVKIELSVLAGPIRDICWDAEGKRLAVVGEGLQGVESGKVIQWDTGVKCGDLGVHSRKKASSCAVRPCRPMRVATGGTEDATVFFHRGPPFQRVLGSGSDKCHERGAVHCLRYNRDGSVLASVGTDGSVCFYEGKEMALIKRLEKVHFSSIFMCAWNRAGTHLLTCGADGFVRLIDTTVGDVVHQWDVVHMQRVGEEKDSNRKVPVGAMQLGCAFVNHDIPIAVSYNGQIAVLALPPCLSQSFPFSRERIDKSWMITGHQAPISALTFGDTHSNTLYTADTSGAVVQWNVLQRTSNGRVTDEREEDAEITESLHAGATVTSLVVNRGILYSSGWDDSICMTQGKTCVDKVKLDAQPNAMTCGAVLIVVMTVKGLLLMRETQIISEMISLPYTAMAICLSKDDSMLYVGGDDCNIYVYTVAPLESNPLSELHVIKDGHLKPVHSLSLCHDGTMLAAADNRDVCIYSTTDYHPIVPKGRWCFHSQRIGCLAWSPDDTIIASGGNDDDLFIWCLAKKMKRLHYRFAHRGGITGLSFVGDVVPGTEGGWVLVSTGHDGCVNWWNVKEDVMLKFN